MEALKKIAAPAASALVLLLILFLCKSAPVSKLWKGYTTLSVPVDTEKGLVENLLDERGCSGCVSLEAQKSEQAGGFFSDYEARKDDFHIMDLDEYIDLAIEFVERLKWDIGIERFVSSSPKDLLIAPQWGLKNFEFTAKIEKRMTELGAYQGKML
jgi:hypothetical protein